MGPGYQVDPRVLAGAELGPPAKDAVPPPPPSALPPRAPVPVPTPLPLCLLPVDKRGAAGGESGTVARPPVALYLGRNVLGRSPVMRVVDTRVARRHAELVATERDLGGLRLWLIPTHRGDAALVERNGAPVAPGARIALVPGDTISLLAGGRHAYRLQADAPTAVAFAHARQRGANVAPWPRPPGRRASGQREAGGRGGGSGDNGDGGDGSDPTRIWPPDIPLGSDEALPTGLDTALLEVGR